MKNSKKMADSVFKIRDAYLEKRRKRNSVIKKIVYIGSMLCIFGLIVICINYFRFTNMKIPSFTKNYISEKTENSAIIVESEKTAESSDTNEDTASMNFDDGSDLEKSSDVKNTESSCLSGINSDMEIQDNNSENNDIESEEINSSAEKNPTSSKSVSSKAESSKSVSSKAESSKSDYSDEESIDDNSNSEMTDEEALTIVLENTDYTIDELRGVVIVEEAGEQLHNVSFYRNGTYTFYVCDSDKKFLTYEEFNDMYVSYDNSDSSEEDKALSIVLENTDYTKDELVGIAENEADGDMFYNIAFFRNGTYVFFVRQKDNRFYTYNDFNKAYNEYYDGYTGHD